MRARMLLLFLLTTTTGCASGILKHGTANQISTLTDLQHRVVLDNLAAFSCNPETIPFQANLNSGTTQAVVQGSIFISPIRQFLMTLGANEGIVDQWGMSPVKDETTLRVLRIAYRRALGFEEDLYSNDLANQLAHRLKVQMGMPSDVGMANALMYSRGPALPQLLDRAGWRGEAESGFRGDDPAVQRWQKDTSDIISTNSERIIQAGEVLREETLTITPVLLNGAPYVPPGETVPRVMVASPYASEVRRQVFAINNYLLEINPGWLMRGESKHDVPKCACYVGHHKECGCVCWIWVNPEMRHEFEDFTLRILRLATLIQDPSAQPQQGVMFSPIATR